MEEIIFKNYGIELLKRNRKIYIRYDSGGIASWNIEKEISEEEATKAQKSEKDAYEVIIKIENQNR